MDAAYENERDAVTTGQNPGYDEADRGNVADAVEGRKEAEEGIAAAEKAADEELVHLDQPENTVDPAVDQTDRFRN